MDKENTRPDGQVLDVSPSKVLVDNLRQFHISSPVEKGVSGNSVGGNASTDNKLKPKNFKQYLPNHEFSDSKFITHIDGDSKTFRTEFEDDDKTTTAQVSDVSIIHGKGYLKKLEEWSLEDRGTVQRKVGSDSETNNENNDQPQWKQHLLFDKTDRFQDKSQLRDLESDLIVTASLSDISGIPTNTFKRQQMSGNKPGKNSTFEPTHSITMDETLEQEPEEAFQKKEFQELEVEEDISDDFIDDPAGKAHSVFDNLIKNQKSKFNLDTRRDSAIENAVSVQERIESEYSNNTDPAIAARSVYTDLIRNERAIHSKQKSEIPKPRRQISNANNNFAKMQPSKNEYTTKSLFVNKQDTSQNDKVMEGKKPAVAGKKMLPLIKPEALGLVFSQKSGVWEKPKLTLSQDISSSRTAENITNTTSEPLSASDRELFESDLLKQDKSSIYDNTPIDTPQINPNILMKANKKQKQKIEDNNNKDENFGSSNAASVTSASEIIQSTFYETKKEVISIITDALTNESNYRTNSAKNEKPVTAWENVTKINLSHKRMDSIYGLDQLLPNLSECDLSNNEIKFLNGLTTEIMHLDVSNNKLSTNFLAFETFKDLEDINLSYNNIESSVFKKFRHNRHLRKVNLSHNNLNEVSNNINSRIVELDLSNNKITGELDFSKVFGHNNCLEILNLSHNHITKIKNIHNLKHLKVLILDNNPINEITISSDMQHNYHSNLIELSALNNNVKHFPLLQDRFFPFLQLKILKTSFDIIDTFKNKVHLPMTLETVELIDNSSNHEQNNQDSNSPNSADSQNRDSLSPPFDFTALDDFLVSLPPTIKKLKIANFKHRFTELPRAIRSQLPILQEINLQGNFITSLYMLLKNLPSDNLRSINLKDNPLVTTSSENQLQQLQSTMRLICPNLSSITVA